MISRVAKLVLIVSSLVAFSACTRIETGEVGVRVNMSKEIQGTNWFLVRGTKLSSVMSSRSR